MPIIIWSLVVPVKVLARAKSRIAALTGVHREWFALAIATDTVAAALTCPSVARVVVVTDDARARQTLGGLGAQVIADAPDAGLNPALRHGASLADRLSPGGPVAALSADLPALRPAELDAALTAAAGRPTAFTADAEGTGTTLYTARTAADFTPAFGPDSCARHAAAGAYPLAVPSIDGLRRDVDTPDHLHAALALGVGPRTAEVAAEVLRTC